MKVWHLLSISLMFFIFLLISSCGGSFNAEESYYGILFVTERDGNMEIYLTKFLQNGDVEVLNLTNNDLNDFSPGWSEQGKIAFLRGPNTGSSLSLMMMNANGSGQNVLYEFNSIFGEFFTSHNCVSWSANGKKIVFSYEEVHGMTERLNPIVIGFSDAYLCVYDTDSSSLTEIDEGDAFQFTTNPNEESDEFVYSKTNFTQRGYMYVSTYDGSKTQIDTGAYDPCWDPTGEKIAYSKETPGSPRKIWKTDKHGSAPIQLSDGDGNDDTPHWIDDKIVYRRETGGSGDVYLIYTGPGGIMEKEIYSNPSSDERNPRLSPDGRKVAFFSDMSGEWRMYVVDVDEQGNPVGEPIEVSKGSVVPTFPPQWSPMKIK